MARAQPQGLAADPRPGPKARLIAEQLTDLETLLLLGATKCCPGRPDRVRSNRGGGGLDGADCSGVRRGPGLATQSLSMPGEAAFFMQRPTRSRSPGVLPPLKRSAGQSKIIPCAGARGATYSSGRDTYAGTLPRPILKNEGWGRLTR